MKQRRTPRWRQALAKMALGFGKVVGSFKGSANGPQIIDLPETKPSSRSKARRKRKRH